MLAIAGLIFLMVFIALPALQRAQRNTQRKNDLSRFVTAVTQYQSNNSGKTPWDYCINNVSNYWAGYTGSSAASVTFSDDKCDISNFVNRYIKAGNDAQFQDPDGEDYKFMLYKTMYNPGYVTDFTSDVINGIPHRIFVKVGVKCSDEEGKMVNVSGKNNFAMIYVLEGGSRACADNQ